MCALASGALAALVLLVAGSVTAQRPGDGQAPRFQVDPWWPKPLPNNWIVGQVSGAQHLVLDEPHPLRLVAHRGPFTGC